MPALPFKLNQDRRHHIPEQKRKVTNWRDYDESLRRRGSLTVWFSDEAVKAWEAERRTSRGGQPEYSDLAILTALTVKAVFHHAGGQHDGLVKGPFGLRAGRRSGRIGSRSADPACAEEGRLAAPTLSGSRSSKRQA